MVQVPFHTHTFQIETANTSQAQTGSNDSVVMTPARTKDAIEAQALLPNSDISVISATASSVVRAGTLRQVPGPHDGLFLGGNYGPHIMCEGLPGDEGSIAVYPGTVNRSTVLSLCPSGPLSALVEDTAALALQIQNGSGDGYSGERRAVFVAKKYNAVFIGAFRTTPDAGPIPRIALGIQDRSLIKIADDNVVRITNELSNGAAGGSSTLVVESPGTPDATLRMLATQVGATVIERVQSNVVQSSANIHPNGIAVGPSGFLETSHRLSASAANSTQSAYAGYASDAGYTGEMARLEATRGAASAFAFMTGRANGDTKFILRGDGNAFADGAWSGGGADYAEYFEWDDGNPDGEDRTGVSVVLATDGKIRPALSGESPVGVVSATAVVVGDADTDFWKGKYLRDDLGRLVMEDIDVVSWEEVIPAVMAPSTREHVFKQFVGPNGDVCLYCDVEPILDEDGRPIAIRVKDGNKICDLVQTEGGAVLPAGYLIEERIVFEDIEVEIEAAKRVQHSYLTNEIPAGVEVPDDAVHGLAPRPKLNPEYDPSQTYQSRSERPEWSTIGLVGKLRVLKGQPTAYRWKKLRDVSADVEEWLVR